MWGLQAQEKDPHRLWDLPCSQNGGQGQGQGKGAPWGHGGVGNGPIAAGESAHTALKLVGPLHILAEVIVISTTDGGVKPLAQPDPSLGAHTLPAFLSAVYWPRDPTHCQSH